MFVTIIITYTLPTNNKFTADSNWNELWIQSGWKNEGDVALLSIEFKDAGGKVVYSLGDAAVEEDVVEVEDDAEEVVEDEVVVEEAKAEPTKVATKDVPKTGIIDFSLLYGLGAVVSGAIVLKRKQK